MAGCPVRHPRAPARALGKLGVPVWLFQPEQDLWHGACTPASASPAQSPGSWLQNRLHQQFLLGARLWAGVAQGQAGSFLLTWLPGKEGCAVSGTERVPELRTLHSCWEPGLPSEAVPAGAGVL